MHDLPFDQFCIRCGLGNMTAAPIPLTGGFLHKMFRVETEKGVFAAKALDPGIMSRPAAPENFRSSEKIARHALQAGLPVLPAVSVDDDILIRTGEQYWMLFSWQDGKALTPDQVTPCHAEKVGEILGRLHTLRPAPGESSDPPIYDWEHFTDAGMPWSEEFARMLPRLKQWNDKGCSAAKILTEGRVLSHRDMDPKNVLWTGSIPCIIDWEAAGPVHPLQEMVETALCWSDDGQKEDRLLAFLRGYCRHCTPDSSLLDAAGYAVILGRLDWLYYNLARSLGAEGADEESRTVGAEQSALTMSALEKLEAVLPLFKKYCAARKE